MVPPLPPFPLPPPPLRSSMTWTMTRSKTLTGILYHQRNRLPFPLPLPTPPPLPHHLHPRRTTRNIPSQMRITTSTTASSSAAELLPKLLSKVEAYTSLTRTFCSVSSPFSRPRPWPLLRAYRRSSDALPTIPCSGTRLTSPRVVAD